MNRRTVLSAAMGAVALSISGCKNTKTEVIFQNNDSAHAKFEISAGGDSFSKSKVQPSHNAKKIFKSSDPLGHTVSCTGTASSVNGTASLPGGTTITEGYTNIFIWDGVAFTGPIIQ